MTGSRHERLDAAIKERRLELGLSWKEVAQAADISEATLRAIRNGANEPSALTARGIERALGWSAGSVERVLKGGEPGEHKAGTGTARVDFDPRGSGRRSDIPSDEELRRSGLQPETAEAIIRMRERIARWIAEGDEALIRRSDRVTEALDEDRDVG
jgi:transcriptional regulator with XRE-family HTH domain